MSNRIAAPAATESAPKQPRPFIPRQRQRPLVVLEERTLDEGVPLVHIERKSQRWHHIAWDPAETTRDKVETWINIYVAGVGDYDEISSKTWRNLQRIALIRRADDFAAEIWDIVEDALVQSNDPDAVFARLCDVLRSEKARRAAGEQVSA